MNQWRKDTMKHGKFGDLMFSTMSLQLDAQLISKHNTKTSYTATYVSKTLTPHEVILSKTNNFLCIKQ